MQDAELVPLKKTEHTHVEFLPCKKCMRQQAGAKGCTVINDFSKAAAAIALTLLCLWGAYLVGYKTAKSEGETAIAQMEKNYADAYAKAMTSIVEDTIKQTQNLLDITSTYVKEKQQNAAKQSALEKQIADITSSSTHVFSAAFVKLWNEAVNALCDSTMPKNDNFTGVNGGARTSKATGSGVQAKQVTEADILAYIVYFGGRSADLEKQVVAWQELARRNGWTTKTALQGQGEK